jgi:hypothetical protein
VITESVQGHVKEDLKAIDGLLDGDTVPHRWLAGSGCTESWSRPCMYSAFQQSTCRILKRMTGRNSVAYWA